jgi:hypothetical protein
MQVLGLKRQLAQHSAQQAQQAPQDGAQGGYVGPSCCRACAQHNKPVAALSKVGCYMVHVASPSVADRIPKQCCAVYQACHISCWMGPPNGALADPLLCRAVLRCAVVQAATRGCRHPLLTGALAAAGAGRASGGGAGSRRAAVFSWGGAAAAAAGALTRASGCAMRETIRGVCMCMRETSGRLHPGAAACCGPARPSRTSCCEL